MRRLLPLLLLPALVLGLVACGDDDDTAVGTDGDVADQPTGEQPGEEPDGDEPVSDDDPAPDAPADQVTYLSVEVTENGAPRPLVDDGRISLTLHGDQRLSASLGCNSLGAEYRIEDGTLVLAGGVSMTEMGCEPDLMDQDQWFAEFLGGSPSFTLDGDTLTIAGPAVTVVLQERSVVDPDRPLEGPDWETTGFLDGDAAMALAVTGDPGRITFDAATSTASGFDGCNAFTAPYEVDGDRVVFGDVSTDDAACDDGQEYVDRFGAVLDGDVAWSIEADRLTLLADDGRGVTFRVA